MITAVTRIISFTSIGNNTVTIKAVSTTNNNHLKNKNAVVKFVKKKDIYLLNIFITNKKRLENNKRLKRNILKTDILIFSPIIKVIKT